MNPFKVLLQHLFYLEDLFYGRYRQMAITNELL